MYLVCDNVIVFYVSFTQTYNFKNNINAIMQKDIHSDDTKYNIKSCGQKWITKIRLYKHIFSIYGNVIDSLFIL